MKSTHLVNGWVPPTLSIFAGSVGGINIFEAAGHNEEGQEFY